MTEAALTVPEPIVESREQFELLKQQAKHLLDSGFLPEAIKTSQQALTIIMKGRELGIPPSYALSNIAVIKGKPTAGAELLLALVYRAHGGNSVRVVETSGERCVVRYKRPEWDEPSTLSFTIEEAQNAGLLASDAWKKYPAHMLRWRAISAACKLGFPEVMAGLYTPEELGARVVVDAAGETWIDAEASEPQARLVDTETGEILEEAPAIEEPAEAEFWTNSSSEPIESYLDRTEMEDDDQPMSPDSRPASPNQAATVAKLSRLCGHPQELAEDATSAEASEIIHELSREYNELKGQGARRS